MRRTTLGVDHVLHLLDDLPSPSSDRQPNVDEEVTITDDIDRLRRLLSDPIFRQQLVVKDGAQVCVFDLPADYD